MFVDDDGQRSTFEQSSEKGSSTLHNILLEQREKLLRNARRKKRQLRQTWFRFYFVLRKAHVMDQQRKYDSTKNRKIDHICDNAGRYCSDFLGLDQIIAKIGNVSKKFVAPLVNAEAKQVKAPTPKEIEQSAADVYSYNFDFSNALSKVANTVDQRISNISNFELITSKSETSNKPINDIVEEAVKNLKIQTAPLNSKEIVEPLSQFSQDTFIFTPFASYEAIADGAAVFAIESLDFTGKALAPMQNTVIPRLRPFLRLAFPRWDNEVELAIDRDITIGSDPIVSIHETYSETTLTSDSIYGAEAKEMLGETQPLIDELVESLFPMFLEDEIYKQISLKDTFDDMLEPPAALIARDLNQDIDDSMSFIDEAIHDSLIKFCGEKIGVRTVIDRVSKFQKDFLKQMLAKKVAESTFHHLSVVTPYLKGAADAKRHKIEGYDYQSQTRKWKEQMMNSIRAFLD